MDILLAVKAIIMGLVEGFTEFLPISSTGHLILAGSLLDFTGEKVKVFEIAIQAGAMLAVIWEYRERIARLLTGVFSDRKQQKFALNVVVAFLPAALLGLLFSKAITAELFKPVPVALAFIVGALVILWVERRHKTMPAALLGLLFSKAITAELFKPVPVAMAFIVGALVILWVERRHKVAPATVRIETVDDMTLVDALKVGCAQAFALIPGTSRSGATIIGGMLFGLSRKAATEFSFFLAIPTLLGATAYSVLKQRELLSMADLPMFGLGGLAAFVSAFLCVRWLLRYISSHDFTIFAWYRIVFGVLVLVTAHYGLVNWAE